MNTYVAPLNDKLFNLVAGTQNILFQRKELNPSRKDIEHICKFFSLGKLQNYKNEKDIIISHSNSIIFVATNLGQYILKFYPKDANKTIDTEYAINRFLLNQRFPTPTMYVGRNGHTALSIHDHRATCFLYIQGRPVWQVIQQHNTISQINTTLLSLKNILLTAPKQISFPKHKKLTTTINMMLQSSHAMTPYIEEKIINDSLLIALQTFQTHQSLFTITRLHNDVNFSNFLMGDTALYLLDLEHIQEDYILSDLSGLVLNSLLFNFSSLTIKLIIKDYFIQHKIKKDHFPVLNTLVKIKLIKKYLRRIESQRNLDSSIYPPKLMRAYQFHLASSQKSIITTLKKITDNPRFII